MKWIPVLLVSIWIGTSFLTPIPDIATMPVQHEGRVKPLDTVARSSLLYLQESQRGGAPIEWLLALWTHPTESAQKSIIKVTHPGIITYLNLNETKAPYYAFDDFVLHAEKIWTHAQLARRIESKKRSAFQRQLIQLDQKLSLYLSLSNTLFPSHILSKTQYLDTTTTQLKNGLLLFERFERGAPLSQFETQQLQDFNHLFKQLQSMAQSAAFQPIPVSGQWITTGEHLLRQLDKTSEISPVLSYYAHFMDQKETVKAHLKIRWEARFHAVNPFIKAMALYLLVFLLAFTPFHKIAFSLFAVAGTLHTAGLIARMWIQNRPPVTNLYSSAIFVGLMAVLLCLFFRKRIGVLVGSAIGFITLIIAHHLSFQGDTLETMQAVLDSNFWLSTHVVTITMGYSGTFIAGGLGFLAIMGGVFTPWMTKERCKEITSLCYGIICFSLVLSFIGTILGGIWADQSWGRFWGWDPKENGALLIVLWCAIILHMRIGGFIRQRGLWVMAVLGNCVTAFSWFGVNMLGIGLHSYGFMDSAFKWLILVVLTQVMIASLGLLPWSMWRSKQHEH